MASRWEESIQLEKAERDGFGSGHVPGRVSYYSK